MRIRAGMLLVGLMTCFGTLIKAEDLTPQTIDAWVQRIRPEDEELTYLQIGWRPTLWEAVAEASQVHKPILLWAMNGHPLGCT